MNRQFALAFQPMLALHLAAGLSVLSAPSAHWTRRARNKSVRILAPTPVALERSAQSRTTTLFALAQLATLVIHSPDAALNVSHTSKVNVHKINEFRFLAVVQEPERTTERPPSCVPSPCGPYSQCQIVGNSPACSCLSGFIGAPPNCRPECVLSAECPSQLACINNKCRDPCVGSCGINAKCHVINHTPVCSCDVGYTGDPFTRCSFLPPCNNFFKPTC